ncbi:MAG: hypothetical protein ABMA15_06900 [Vicinamibacterales bacterium]
MADKGFEPQVAPFLFGDVDQLSVVDSGFASKLIIPRTQQCQVMVKWHIDGLLSGALGGRWKIRTGLESMGPGAEYSFTAPDVPLSAGVVVGTQRNYNATITIPAGSVNENAYRLVATITYVEPGNTPGPLAAYEEGPIVQFFEP